MKKKTVKVAMAAPKIKLLSPMQNAVILAECAALAAVEGADLIVFPELSITGATAGNLFRQELVLSAAEEGLLKYAQLTSSFSLTSFVGLPVRSGDKIFNAVAVLKKGKLLGVSLSTTVSGVFSPAAEEEEVTLLSKKYRVSRSAIISDKATRAKIIVRIGDNSVPYVDGASLCISPYAAVEYIGRDEEEKRIGTRMSLELGCPVIRVGAGIGESGTDGVYSGRRAAFDGEYTVYTSPLFENEVRYVEITPRRGEGQTVPAPEAEPPRRSPFIHDDPDKRDEACALALEITSRALAERMERSFSKYAVLGVSGGLDSTLAILVAARAVKLLGLDAKHVVAITMPCFGTSARTKSNALLLSDELGCDSRTIDIRESVTRHFKDIGHAENVYDVVYENSQARERTQVLMDVANAVGGLVVGTGDLSELALGFATYNGDHMSMYCVNGSVPKTLMREIISYDARRLMGEGKDRLAGALLDVVNTPVSPELLPNDGGESSQYTERIVGPYELHDFFLYYTVKYGYSPTRILEMASKLFPEYKGIELQSYLDIFLRRFYSQQFKRSCMPDGPRVTEISLSPRSSWHMPSDVSPLLWREDIAKR